MRGDGEMIVEGGGGILPVEAEDAADKQEHIPASPHNRTIILLLPAFACAAPHVQTLKAVGGVVVVLEDATATMAGRSGAGGGGDGRGGEGQGCYATQRLFLPPTLSSVACRTVDHHRS